MKVREIKNGGKVIINVFFETLTFIFTIYLISCFLISFQQSFFKILISCLNISVMANYKTSIEKDVSRRLSNLLLIASVILIGIIIYKYGYFEVSNTITKF